MKLDVFISGFRYGVCFIIFCRTKTCESQHKLAEQIALLNKEIVNQTIQTELRAGRIAKPFKDEPFKNFRVSLLGKVPKIRWVN